MQSALPISLPHGVGRLCTDCAELGGLALLVGGSVRDALLQQPTKDLDIEVHRIEPAALARLLRRYGRVDEVGRSFGVFKLRLEGVEVDVSVPRRDSKEGPGHRGIRASADPNLGIREAARRRDLTVNAIAWDPLTTELHDPFNGAADLAAGLLRAVDPHTFGEDPLRALRVAQFAGRFGFRVDPDLAALCADMPLSELPAERVRGEVEKLLLRSRRPSVGWTFAHETGQWRKVLPAWDTPCPPHLDRLAALSVEGVGRRLALLLAASAHTGGVLDVCDRLRIFKVAGFDTRTQALALAAARDGNAFGAYPPRERARRLAESVEVELFAALLPSRELAEAAQAQGIERMALLPLLSGRDLLAAGVPAGPGLGTLLANVREQQLAGHLSSPEAALTWARARLQ